MKKSVFSFSCCLLIIVLLSTFTGCGGKQAGTGETGGGGSQTTQQAAAEATSGQAEAKEAVELVFWDMVWGPAEYIETSKQLMNKFTEANPSIKIKYQSTPWDNFYQTFTVAIAAGNAPDVSTGAGFQQHQFAQMDEILALDPIIEQWKSEGTLDDFIQGAIEHFQYKGKQVGIPWNVDPRGVFYRKDLFEKAGVPVPKNWDELYDALKKLTKDGVYGLVFPSSDTSGYWSLAVFLFNNGGRIFDAETLAPDFANEKNVEALDFMRRLKREKLVPEGIVSYTDPEAQKIFLQGKAAMIITGASFSPTVLEQPKEFSDNVEIFNTMMNKDGKQITPVGMNGIMAYKQSRHPQEAMTFIKWWSENNADLWGAGHVGSFPARKSTLAIDYFKNDKFKKSLAELVIPYGIPQTYPSKNAFPEMANVEGELILRDALQQALTTDTDSKAILSELNEKIKGIVAENK